MIGSISRSHHLTGAEIALQLLKVDHSALDNHNQFASNKVEHPADTVTYQESYFTPRASHEALEAISKIQELISGKIKIDASWGSVDASLNAALWETGSVLPDDTVIANFDLSDDDLKELGLQLLKKNIAEGFMDDNPALIEAFKSGKFEVLLEDEMEGNPVFLQGKFKKVGDSYGFFSDNIPSTKADREFRNAFYASGKRAISYGLGPVNFGIIY